MDQDLRALQAALEREPENGALRERFLRACARAEEPVLVDGLELVALLFEGLAAVAYTRPQIAESPSKEGPAGALELLVPWLEVARGGEALAFELTRQRLARDGRGPRVPPYGPAKTGTSPDADSIQELFEEVVLDLSSLALAGETRSEPWVGLIAGVFEAAGAAVNACFEDGNDHWSYSIEPIAAPERPSGPGEGEAVPALFPTLHGTGTAWGGRVGAEDEAGPLSPFLRGLFRRAFGPGWMLCATERKAPAFSTYYSYQILQAGERWYGFETLYD